MWLLTTRQRPKLAAEALAACAETGMTSEGIVYIDGDEHGLYKRLTVPTNWTVHRAEHGGLSRALQWCLETFPHERFYGWLADDMAPRTPGWDRKLEDAAGTRCMAQANDLWSYIRDPVSARTGLEPTAGHCWGGDLIRTVGWWALPGSVQAGTDVAWARLVHRLQRMRFCDDVTVEHRHWRRGARRRDSLDTDMYDSNGHTHTDDDLKLLWAWLDSRDFYMTVRKVRLRCPVHGGRRVVVARVK